MYSKHEFYSAYEPFCYNNFLLNFSSQTDILMFYDMFFDYLRQDLLSEKLEKAKFIL